MGVMHWYIPDVLGRSLFVCGPHRHCSGDLLRHLFVQGSPSLVCKLETENIPKYVCLGNYDFVFGLESKSITLTVKQTTLSKAIYFSSTSEMVQTHFRSIKSH